MHVMRAVSAMPLPRRSARILNRHLNTLAQPAADGPAAVQRTRKTSIRDGAPREEKNEGPSLKGNSRAKASTCVGEASASKEESLWASGFNAVCGVDEAGRGPLAGPVVAAACVIPRGTHFPGLRDSKKLTEAARERLYEEITSCPGVAYAIEIVHADVIDRVNILQATLLAMAGSICKLGASAGADPLDYILVDGNRLPEGLPGGCQAEAIIKGDATCRVIAAASVLAKVTRDRMMLEYDRAYPAYGFKDHKGYGTAKHLAALLKHGPSSIHRRSFAPIKDWES